MRTLRMVLALLLTATAWAQGVRTDGFVINRDGHPVPQAKVRLCALDAGHTDSQGKEVACAPTVPIYANRTLTSTLPNPTYADGMGNYRFYTACGTYTLQVSGYGLTLRTINDFPVPCLTQGTGDLTLPAQPVDVGTTFNGAPTSLMALVRHPFPFAVTIPAGCVNSYLLAETAATASATFSLQKCTAVGSCSEFGTAVIGAGGTSASFTCASATSFAAGQYLRWLAPETPDASLVLVGGSIYGVRSPGIEFTGTTQLVSPYTVYGNGTGSVTGPYFYRPSSLLLSDAANLCRLDAASNHLTGDLQIDGEVNLPNVEFWTIGGLTFAGLLAQADGTVTYCADCDTPAPLGASCASSGDRAGAEAHKIRGVWKCF